MGNTHWAGAEIADFLRIDQVQAQAFIEAWRRMGTECQLDLLTTLPEQMSKLELSINLETAKALGLTVPLPLLGRADEVIA